jgi:hypothetical protein
MNEFERRIWRQIHALIGGFSKWWGGLRESDAGKRATTALHDMRDTDAAKRAASALADLRQREPVRKAEESARRALHDLRSGRGSNSTAA